MVLAMLRSMGIGRRMHVVLGLVLAPLLMCSAFCCPLLNGFPPFSYQEPYHGQGGEWIGPPSSPERIEPQADEQGEGKV